LIVFQSDNIVVGHFLGAAKAPIYSLTYNLFNNYLLLQTLSFSYLWVAYTEAIAHGDIAWIRRAYRPCAVGGTALTLALATCLCFIAQPFIGWWAGPQVVPLMSRVDGCLGGG
jgi:O-antigen/teichoic acid export membrane protein